MGACWWGCNSFHIAARWRSTASPEEPQEESFATYSAVGSLEAVDLLLGAVKLVLGSEGLEDVDDVVPELFVVLVEQDDEAGGLGVEGRRDVKEGLLNKLRDLGV